MPRLHEEPDGAASPREPESKGRLAVLAGIGLLLTAGLFGVRVFLFSPLHTSSGSMLPTLAIGETFWVDKWTYRRSPVQRGDLVVASWPDKPGSDFIKRVIGVAGDHLSIKGQAIEVNGKPLRAAGAAGRPYEYLDKPELDGPQVKVAALRFDEQIDQISYQVLQNIPPVFDRELEVDVLVGDVYLLGDNRDRSLDSRFLGSAPESLVHGRVVKSFSASWLTRRGPH